MTGLTMAVYVPGTRVWIEQAVVISWFTDARLPDDAMPPDASADRRGHWGDMFLDGQGAQSLGSLLWTLRRAKLTQATVNRARDIATDALVWLLATPYVRAIDVTAERLDNQTLALAAAITLPDNSRIDVTETYNAA